MHKKTLVGWVSHPSRADKMSTPQEKLLQHFSLATLVGCVTLSLTHHLSWCPGNEFAL
ncbi:hypothetical protein FDUTEX481_01901 [Tolypothrix sp. PCC 7601]|nr:hypothetical protein FDUTEX481_01901 [Tolypothrix sp. PCC 7601]